MKCIKITICDESKIIFNSIIKKLKKDKLFRKWIKENANFLRNEYGDYPYFSTANILTAFKKKITLFEAVEQSRIIKSISE